MSEHHLVSNGRQKIGKIPTRHASSKTTRTIKKPRHFEFIILVFCVVIVFDVITRTGPISDVKERHNHRIRPDEIFFSPYVSKNLHHIDVAVIFYMENNIVPLKKRRVSLGVVCGGYLLSRRDYTGATWPYGTQARTS